MGGSYRSKYKNSDKWSPALQIRTVLLSIQALLSAPNPLDPLANDVAEHWKDNEAGALEKGELFLLLCFHPRVAITSERWFVKGTSPP